MSLMLDALKRIEAKQASARAAASAPIVPSEPADGVEVVDPIGNCDSIGDDCPNPRQEERLAACLAPADEDKTEHSLAVVETPIDFPPDLTADSAVELSAEDIASPAGVSLESAMSELSDLLARARLIDQQPASEPTTPSPTQEVVESAYSTGFSQNVETPLEKDSEGRESNDWSLAQVAANQTDAADSSEARSLPTEDETTNGEPDDWSWMQESLDQADASGASEDLANLPTIADHAGVAPGQCPGGTASDEPEQVFAEPPVIEPIASDPYAAAAWQLLRQLPAGGSNVVLFTSPSDRHGKTITLARLLPHVARSFSGSVLVVDANTRNPDLARWLEVAATWRLTDVLAGATHWMNAVRPTALPRVSLLPGGTETSRQPNAHAAARLLRELAAHYDLVLVDASSLAHSGAAPLAAACDGTCLVVRLGESSHRVVREAAQVVSQSGGRLLGCIAIDAGA